MKIVETPTFTRWIEGMRDRAARVRIATRIQRFAMGNAGDVKPIGGGLSELRIHYGPGYRVYLKQQGDVVVILLCGGDKGTQAADVAKAKLLAKETYHAD